MISSRSLHESLVWVVICFLALTVWAQEGNRSLNQAEIIDSVTSLFRACYVYPEVAIRMDSLVRANFAASKYANDTTLESFLESIRNDLQEISSDRHVWIEAITENRQDVIEGDTVSEDQVFLNSLENFGWKKAEVLPCGVGYIKVDAFQDSVYAAQTAAHAFGLMANCQAIIIDLREHHGGYENMQVLACSYFFERPTQLAGLYWTYLDSLVPAWTLPEIPGVPLYDKELYLLTSSATASGGEAFAYNLKHSNRATLVGETTRGAAHWTEDYEVPSLDIVVSVPVARPIHPVTGTNWERTGVKPHIEVPSETALKVAYLEILKSLRKKATNKLHLRQLEWYLPAAEAAVNPVSIDSAAAIALTGTYLHPDQGWEYRIAFEDGRMVMYHHSGEKFRLVPLTKTYFGFHDRNDLRVMFDLDSTGRATEYRYIYANGDTSVRPRSKD